MRVIGTAGHVDHGKSTLIEALTGVHPDRLKEERLREMTIDLGFGWMTLSSPESGESEEIGIVDVPGHRDFIENMLAGIGGIDASLFVVAADEGVMPQTREHLAILDILQIDSGVIALTKIDMVADPDWLDLVEADLMDVIQGTALESAPIIRVSAPKQIGLDELREALRLCLTKKAPRADLNRPRIPVDRVFSIAGFGTVITGTLSDGHLNVGDEVEILPSGVRSRIRGLQTHKQSEERALPGSRTAVNFSGLAMDEIQRGDVVAHPGAYQATQRLDVNFRLLPDVSQSLKHNAMVKLFIGATESMARLRLLGSEELKPGETGWLQLEPNLPVVAVRGDRFILRRPSPGETLGGGAIIDPHPKRRHKRFSETTIQRLEALAKGTPTDVLQQSLLSSGVIMLSDLISQSRLDQTTAQAALQELSTQGLFFNLNQSEHPSVNEYQPKDWLISKTLWEQINEISMQASAKYHQEYPLRRGIPKEELISRLKKVTRHQPVALNLCMQRIIQEGKLIEAGPLLHLPEHSLQFNEKQKTNIEQMMRKFEAEPYAPPPLKECQAEVGEEVINALIELDELVLLPPDVLFRKADYEKMLAELRALFAEHETLTVAQVRDHFQTSRRYILALLERLDSQGITARKGDARILKK